MTHRRQVLASSGRRRVGAAARVLAQAVPDRALSRLLPRGLRWDAGGLTVAEAPATPVRLYIAPVNSAGQGFRWARAAEQHLAGVGAVSLMTTTDASEKYGFDVDVAVPAGAFVMAAQWRRRQRAALEGGFTHVLIESGRFAYGSVPGSTPQRVAEGLAGKGLGIAMLWHGSDIRVPSEHASQEPDSPFGPRGEYPANSVTVLERNARENRRLIDDTDFPVFVSTPGLLGVPRSQWLPVVVDAQRWATTEAALTRERPIVVYAPSNSPMKGDVTIDEQLAALDEAGVIEYRRLCGIPSADMPEVFRGADIVLDQFRLGDYGVAACEAMAAGRVVIGHVSDIVRARVRELTGLELPIVEARYSSIGETVRGLIEDRERGAAHAVAGVPFVETVHDGRRSAAALAPFLGLDADEPILEGS